MIARTTAATSPPAATGPERPEIVSKIQWLMFFRVVMVTVLLGSTLIVNLNDPELLTDSGTVTVLALIVGTYLLTIAYAVLLPRLRNHGVFAYAQLMGDLLTSGLLVVLTGGTESVFLFMFSLTVLNASVLLYRRGALTMAAIASALITLVILREWMGWGIERGPLSGTAVRSLLLTGVTNVSAVFLVALLAGHLSEQLRAAGQRLRYASEDLEQLRALNQHIIVSIQSGLVSYTLDARIIFFNPAAERITGYSAHELLFRPVYEIFPWLEARRPGDDAALSRWEQPFERRDAGQRVLGCSLSPLVDSQGQHRGYVLVFQDLTPLRRMEDQIRRSEKFAAIGKMAAGIAHEIRNPLASISGSIQMLARTGELAATDQRLMDIILREIDRLNALITDFLKFARPAPPEMARADLRRLVEEVVEVFRYMRTGSTAEPLSHAVAVLGEGEPDGAPLLVEADARQLKQVVWNLLKNAVEAMPEGGTVEVALSRAPVGPDGRPGVEVAIADQGVGIPAEDLPRIFDPFFSTKSRGTGLGLALAHRILEDHRGTLRVDSEPDRGTTFVFALPLAQPVAGAPSRPPEPAPPAERVA